MLWKASPSFPKYEVSEFGDVRRAVPSKDGRPAGDPVNFYLKAGYRRYGLWKDGKQRHVKAARLVIEAFVGPIPFEGAAVCHNDGEKRNDHFQNLRWDSHAGNMADKIIHGTSGLGKLKPRRKYDELS